MFKFGTQHQTDKVTHHGYHRFYPQYIDYIQEIDTEEVAIFEIGLYKGASLSMWLDYFPKAYIYGLDIQNGMEGPRTKIFKGDQSKPEILNRVISLIPHPVVFINDDGSHIPEHQIISFNILFNRLLQNGGTYIIEDIETSYWSKGGIYGYPTLYGLYHQESLIEKFKLVLDYLNREFLSSDNLEIIKNKLKAAGFDLSTLSLVQSVTFAANCIILKKTTTEDSRYTNRNYRFAGQI